MENNNFLKEHEILAVKKFFKNTRGEKNIDFDTPSFGYRTKQLNLYKIKCVGCKNTEILIEYECDKSLKNTKGIITLFKKKECNTKGCGSNISYCIFEGHYKGIYKKN